jgi:hypothetical protein
MYAVALLPFHEAIPMALVMATDENLSPEARKARLSAVLNLVDRVAIPEEKIFAVAEAMANVATDLRSRKNAGQVEAELAEMLTESTEKLMDRIKCNCIGDHDPFICASTAHLCREPLFPGDRHAICGLSRDHDFGTLSAIKHGHANPNYK